MRSFLRKGIFANPGLKLLALLLALLVYGHVVTEKEEELEVVLPLRTWKLSESLALVAKPPDRIRVKVRGTGKQLLWTRVFAPEVRVSLAEAGAGRHRVELTAGDVSLPPGLDVHVSEVIEPKSLALEIEPRATRRVPVVAAVVGTFAPGVGLARDPSVDPDSVEVSGARRLLATVDAVRTEAVDVSDLKERAVFETRLDSRGLYLALEPERVVVTVDVERLAERRFEGIPVQVLHDGSMHRAAADPASGSVLVVGPQTAVHSLRPEDVRLVIDARGLAPGHHEAPAQASLAGGLSAASLEPKVFRITLE